ncbi:MAG: GntR family transcriptional regulator [Clostridiales bacterium]|nr:GntR family transcriptional regulator [Clostridiales bacterium]
MDTNYSGREEFKRALEKQPFLVIGDFVYNYLCDEIIRMHLPPGTKINEANIAKELEISRSPVHAAVCRLMDDQLIHKEEGKYPYVSLVSAEDCLKISQARSFLESSAAYFAAQMIEENEVKQMLSLAEKYEKAVSDKALPNFEICDHSFHSQIIYNSKNKYFIEMYKCIEPRILRYRYYLRKRLAPKLLQETLKESTKSHYAICKALQIGLPAVARDEVYRHSDQMRDVFTK